MDNCIIHNRLLLHLSLLAAVWLDQISVLILLIIADKEIEGFKGPILCKNSFTNIF